MTSRYKILALDVATNTGWSVGEAHGTWDLRSKRDESVGMRLIRFRSKLEEVFKLCEINLVVFERVAGHHQNAVIVAAELVGVVKTFCEDNKIEYRAYSAGEIKRHATGKGNSNKAAMIAAAKEKLNYQGEDDNEVDAMWLHALATHDLTGGTNE